MMLILDNCGNLLEIGQNPRAGCFWCRVVVLPKINLKFSRDFHE